MNIQKLTYLAYYIPYMEYEISGMLKPTLCLAVIAALLPLMSCENSHPPELAGHWLHESGSTDKKPEDMELLKDGTGVCDGDSIAWKAKDKRLIILSPTLGFASDYEVAGYRLALTDKAGKSTYVNINEDYQQRGNFTDSRDNKKYGTIKIGNQTWTSENLNYDSEGSKCYGNDPDNCEKYGRLYDWNTAMKACPSGWHLPNNAEWKTLVDFAGGKKVAGKKLKARGGWYNNGNGEDSFGFSALPGGVGEAAGGFGDGGKGGDWWSATEHGASRAYDLYVHYGYAEVIGGNFVKTSLYSVRCVQD